ncbi:hypothetical protein GQ53DRAFT_740365 [Thozetella sp. PMI_491]|nr:hypothetical protein GQ53DRAFT_740365 [Thozetella sp. PMI_491]
MGGTPPPSYDEAVAQRGGPGEMGTANFLRPSGIATISIPRLMPLDFNIYSESATSGEVYFIGPHQVDRQFALTFNDNSRYNKSKPIVTLHDGLTPREPAIASATNVSPSHKEPWDEFAITSTISGLQAVELMTRIDKGSTFWHAFFNFRYAVETGASGGTRKEFEWQESGSAEVQRLGGEPQGWRLIELGSESETLAVWTQNSNSWTKHFRFAFRGRGRIAEYGPRWEVMAILTAVTVWRRGIEINNA